MPRFSAANRKANTELVAGLQPLARRWDMTPTQLAIGWVLGKEPTLTPVLGMRTLAQVDEATSARPLSPEQMREVETIVPRGSVSGTRYAAAQMAALDSEEG